MKKILFLAKISKTSKMMAVAFFAFMLFGAGSVSAQYVAQTDALVLLKAQQTTIVADMQNATADEAADLALQLHYYSNVAKKIDAGADVTTVLDRSQVVFSNYKGSQDGIQNFKQRTTEIVDEAKNLLTE